MGANVWTVFRASSLEAEHKMGIHGQVIYEDYALKERRVKKDGGGEEAK